LSRIESRSQAVLSGLARTRSQPLVLLQHFRDSEAVRSVLATLFYLHATEVPISVLRKILRPDELSKAVTNLEHASAISSDVTRNTLALHPSAREMVRLELESGSLDRNKLLVCALNSITSELSTQFTKPRTLLEARQLSLHALAVLENSMEVVPDPGIFNGAVSLALRYCTYLLADGHYVSVVQFVPRFRRWCRAFLQRKAYRNVDTTLKTKFAIAQASTGSIHDALRLFNESQVSRNRHLGKDNISTLHSLNNVALSVHDLGNYEEAVDIHSKVLRLKSQQLGKLDADTLVSANNLGTALQSQGRHNAAQRLFERSLCGWSQIYDPDNLFVLSAQSNRGISLFLQGQLDGAEHDHRLVYRERRRILGRIHHETLKSKSNLAMTINDKGNHKRAEQLYREVFRGFLAGLGPTHPDTLKTYTNLATCLHDQEKFEQAEALVLHAIPLLKSKYGPWHAKFIDAMEFRAILLHCLQQYVTALEVATFVYDARHDTLGYDHADTQRSLGHVRDLAENCEEESSMGKFPAFVEYAKA
jgi:tetratricopeptide (TPR) repeat protein